MRSPENHDLVNGQWVPQLLIDGDHVLDGHHQGTVRVRAGDFHLAGTLQGTLWVDAGATARVTGGQRGEVRVAPGATLLVEPGGRLAGELVNDGEVVVRGVFGGERRGTGGFRLEGGGFVGAAPGRVE